MNKQKQAKSRRVKRVAKRYEVLPITVSEVRNLLNYMEKNDSTAEIFLIRKSSNNHFITDNVVLKVLRGVGFVAQRTYSEFSDRLKMVNGKYEVMT